MAVIQNLSKVNPCSPIFYLKIGETEVTYSKSVHCADNFMSFSMKLTAEDVASDIEILLYDDSALALEYEILKGYKNVQFKFGQDMNNMSKMYDATITDYELEFVNLGVQLTLKLILGAVGATSEESKSYKGTPSEVFKKVCKEEDWIVGKVSACDKSTKETFARTGQTASDFITKTLIPKANATGKEYTFYTESQDGKTLAHFTTKKKDMEDYTVYEIVIGQDHESVINFKPSFSGLMYNLLGGGQSPSSGTISTPSTTGTSTSSPLSGTTKKAEFTAYHPGPGIEGGYGQASGGYLDPSKNTCAAPKDIPFGTKIQISGTGTSYDGKIYTVTDRGGAIKVRSDGTYCIDILMSNSTQCNSFGRRKGTITILNSTDVSSGSISNSKTKSSSNTKTRELQYTASGELINGSNTETISTSTGANISTNSYLNQSQMSVVVPAIDKLTNNLITASTDKKIINRRVGTSSYNSNELGKLAEYLFTRSVMLSNSAELTLRGDSSLQPQCFVVVMVLTKDGFFHHSSGLYQVLEVSHDLDMGNYVTTLNMFRRGMQVNEDGSITLMENSILSSTLQGGTQSGVVGTTGTGSNIANSVGDFVSSSEIQQQFDSKFKGLPYSLGAKGAYPQRAYDCSGFVCAMIKELAKAHGGDTRIGIGNTQSMIKDYANYSVGWDKSKLQPGDILIGVNDDQSHGVDRHVVMYVGDNTICHAGSPLKYATLDSQWNRFDSMDQHAVIRILAAKDIYTKVPADWASKVY